MFLLRAFIRELRTVAFGSSALMRAVEGLLRASTMAGKLHTDIPRVFVIQPRPAVFLSALAQKCANTSVRLRIATTIRSAGRITGSRVLTAMSASRTSMTPALYTIHGRSLAAAIALVRTAEPV